MVKIVACFFEALCTMMLYNITITVEVDVDINESVLEFLFSLSGDPRLGPLVVERTFKK